MVVCGVVPVADRTPVVLTGAYWHYLGTIIAFGNVPVRAYE